MGENQKLLKYSTLAVITLQTSSMVLLLRYSRRQSIDSNEAYFNSTAVFLSELLKLFICIVWIIWNETYSGLGHIIQEEIFGKPKEFAKILVPAGLYTIQNNLLFLALSNLDAATYQVTYQFKILTTALFSVLLLNKRLSVRQWSALFLLMVGVILVQWPNESSSSAIVKKSTAENKLVGLLAVIISSFSSGFSGVYFEKLIKHSNQSLWTRNTQLAIISCFLSLATIYINDYEEMSVKGFFYGYNLATWGVIVLQSFGGICVSLVMKYADNILKGFATTISIVLSSLCSYFLFADFDPNHLFYGGTLLVVTSTTLYSL